jgi:uncharacterized protein (TIGR00251 family)
MTINKAENGVILSVRVKAGSGTFSIVSEGDIITIRTKSPAEDNKANMEIVKELSRLFGREVRILRGLKSRNKEILIKGVSEGDLDNVIS